MATPETRQLLLAAAAACEDKKGEDTRILELDPADSGLADFFLITSATNDRQVLAISDEIELRLKREFGVYPASVEGRRQAEWILLDYVDLVIHVFLAEKRVFYDIERLRKSARSLTASDVASLRTALAEKTRAVRTRATKKSVGRKAAAKPSPAPERKASSPKKLSKKGDSTVKAKATGKAVKKSAPKPAFKAGKELKAAKTSTAKVPSKKASAKAPIAASKVAVGAAGGAKPTVKQNSAPILAASAPHIVDMGAKPPILKSVAPAAMSIAASAEAKKPAKAAIKKAAPKKKKAALVVNKLR